MTATSLQVTPTNTYRVICTDLVSENTLGNPEPPLGMVIALHKVDGAAIPLWLTASLALTVLLSSFFLFVFLRRISARDIPGDMEVLTEWLDNTLNDRGPSVRAPALRFNEMKCLGDRIAQIIERHEKERDQAAIGHLTSGIMHDLKTPIHPLVTAHGLVAEQPEGSPKRLQRLENLFRVCSTNLPIIGNLIESTLDGNRSIHLEPKPVDLRQTIQNAVDLHSASVRHRNVGMELDLGDRPVVVSHDPTQLARVFSNMIKNSLDAIDDLRTRDGLAPGRLWVRIAQTHDATQVSLEDSGPGLPENPEKVFRVFRSAKPRGSGLGLNISRKIVEAHGGQMLAGHPEHLSGARFDVILPNPREESRRV